MFENLMNSDNTRVLDKMRKKHQINMEKLKLQSELDIEKDNLMNDLKLKKLQSNKARIGSKREMSNITNLVRKDTLTKRAGYLLKFWAILTTIVSTVLTMAGGYKDYKNNTYSLIGFLSAVVVLQFTVFIIASQETRIKQEFFTHSWKCTLLKYALLSVSIYNNYKFFDSTKINGFITLILCIALDMVCVFLIGLAYDQITLNVFKKVEKKNKNIFEKMLYNLTARQVEKINNKYKENIKIVEKGDPIMAIGEPDQPKVIELKKKNDVPTISLSSGSIENEGVEKMIQVDEELKSKIGFNTEIPDKSDRDSFNITDIKEYLKCMYELSAGLKSIGQTKLRDNTGLGEQQIRNIRYFLAKNNIVEIRDKQTKILVDNYKKALKIICLKS